MGRTRTNRLTFFPAAHPAGRWQPGDLVEVRIEEVRPFSLSGSVPEYSRP